VADRFGKLRPKLLISDDAHDVMHRRTLAFKKRHQNVAQDVLHAHAPRLGPHLFENFEEAGGGEGDAIFTDLTKGIVAIRLSGVAGIEIDHIGLARLWDTCSNAVSQLAVGIDKSKTISMLQILNSHVLQQGRFAGARLAENVEMREAILR